MRSPWRRHWRAVAVVSFLVLAVTAEALIARCESLYAAQGLPPLFRIVERAETRQIDAALAERGYHVLDRSLVLVCDIDDFRAAAAAGAAVRTVELDDWLPLYYELSNANVQTQPAHRRILTQSRVPYLLAAVFTGDKPVACGMGALDGSFLGFFDIVTHPDYRGQGYGTQLMGGLVAWAQGKGALTLYLQVVEQNLAARRFYEKLGFHLAYTYWYRIRHG